MCELNHNFLTRIKWLLNDTLLEVLNITNIETQEFATAGKLTFNNVHARYNDSVVVCSGTYQLCNGVMVFWTSKKSTLLVQGKGKGIRV